MPHWFQRKTGRGWLLVWLSEIIGIAVAIYAITMKNINGNVWDLFPDSRIQHIVWNLMSPMLPNNRTVIAWFLSCCAFGIVVFHSEHTHTFIHFTPSAFRSAIFRSNHISFHNKRISNICAVLWMHLFVLSCICIFCVCMFMLAKISTKKHFLFSRSNTQK